MRGDGPNHDGGAFDPEHPGRSASRRLRTSGGHRIAAPAPPKMAAPRKPAAAKTTKKRRVKSKQRPIEDPALGPAPNPQAGTEGVGWPEKKEEIESAAETDPTPPDPRGYPSKEGGYGGWTGD